MGSHALLLFFKYFIIIFIFTNMILIGNNKTDWWDDLWHYHDVSRTPWAGVAEN